MKRLITSAVLLGFLFGIVIIPAIHHIKSGENHDSDHENSCSICQLTHTPVVKAIPDVTLFVVHSITKNVGIPPSIPSFPEIIYPCSARAPPAC